MPHFVTRRPLRSLLVAALAAVCSSMPVGADESPEPAAGWVPDEVRAQGSTRFT